jgi:hypothetical protein
MPAVMVPVLRLRRALFRLGVAETGPVPTRGHWHRDDAAVKKGAAVLRRGRRGSSGRFNLRAARLRARYPAAPAPNGTLRA